MRRLWLDVHRWVGLKLSILLSFVLITGTLATLGHEIDWLIDPDRRLWPPAVVERYDWQGMAEAARAAYPDWVVEWIEKPLDAWFTAEAVAYTPSGERRRIFIDPATLQVTGDGGWVNAQRILRDSHRRLMIFHPAGIMIVSALSILLLISMVTGLVIYRKFWRGFFKAPRGRNARTLWGDLHRLGGVWSLWFIFLMAITGLWYLIEAAGARAPAFPVERRNGPTPAGMEETIPLNALAETARAALPGFDIHQIFPPHHYGEPVRFVGQTDTLLVRDRANAVAVSPLTGDVTAVLDSADLSVHQRISEMADPLHFGTFGGLPVKLLYFVFGIILSGMSLSGIYIYSARLRKSAAARTPRPAGAPLEETRA